MTFVHPGSGTDRILLPWHDPAPRSVALRIASVAAQAVVEGRLAAGTLLTEAQLAAEAGASRTPAREAMVQLQSWGLVRLVPKKGGIVTSVSPTERRDLVDLRATLEIRGIQRVAASTTDRTRLAERLRTSLSAQQTALRAGDLLAFSEHDVDFHLRIIEAGGNAVVDGMATALGPRFARLTHLAVSGDGSAAMHYGSEHEALIHPIEAGDAAGFAAAVRRHIASAHFPGELA
ncbi:GntR family transcriptional regulator [Microbacterium sp. A93]|uniref:GntR family transcriptional regulator n=1 Tax=Microbacterium sp. A93 TaxID=3450716 RepID=UPI003F42D19B